MNDVWNTLSVSLGLGEVFHLGKKGAPWFWRMKRPWKLRKMEFSYLSGRNWEKSEGLQQIKRLLLSWTHTHTETYVKPWSLFMCGFVTLSSRDPQRSSRERREGRRPWDSLHVSRTPEKRTVQGRLSCLRLSPRLLGLVAHNLWLRVVLRALGVFSCIHMMLTVYQHLIAFPNPIK